MRIRPWVCSFDGSVVHCFVNLVILVAGNTCSQGSSSRRARDQVVTLQDSVVNVLSQDIQSAFAGEKVWLHSQNVPVAEIEAGLRIQRWIFYL